MTITEWIRTFPTLTNLLESKDRGLFEELTDKSDVQALSELELLYGDLYLNFEAPAEESSAVVFFQKRSSLVWNMHIEKYAQMHSLLNTAYNPLDNYRMTESGSDSTSRKGDTESTSEVNRTSDSSRKVEHSDNGKRIDEGSTAGERTDDLLSTHGGTVESEDLVTRNLTKTSSGNSSTSKSTANIDVQDVSNGMETLEHKDTSYDTVTPKLTYTDTRTTSGTTKHEGSTSETGSDNSTATVTDTGTVKTASSTEDKTTVSNTGTVKEKSVSSNETLTEHSSESSDTVSMTGKDTTTVSGVNNESTQLTHTLTRSGNIGVTTSQKMYKDELVLIPKKLIYPEFYKDWVNTMCLSVYKF